MHYFIDPLVVSMYGCMDFMLTSDGWCIGGPGIQIVKCTVNILIQSPVKLRTFFYYINCNFSLFEVFHEMSHCSFE